MSDQTETQHANFYELVNESPVLQAQMESVTEAAIHAAREQGADISVSDAISLPSVRLAIMTDGSYDKEILDREMLNHLPAVRAAKRQAALRAEVSEGKTDGVMAQIANLTPAQAMEWSRKNLPEERRDTTPQHLTAEEEARVIRSLADLPPAVRMTVARRFGLGV